MDIISAKVRIEEALARCAAGIERDGIKASCKVWFEDKELEECPAEGKAAYISGEILVLSEGMREEDGLVIVFTIPCRGGSVSDEELESELLGFAEAADELIGEMSDAPDAKEYLADRIRKTDEEAREMMKRFDEQMKKMRRGGIIFGVAVAVLAMAFWIVSMLI